MKKAKIIGSNSHIDHVALIREESEANLQTPGVGFEFGQFVRLAMQPSAIIGVVYDSKLVDPQLSGFVPRLKVRSPISEIDADRLKDESVLIGILLLGTLSDDGVFVQGVPPILVPHGVEVEPLCREDIRRFHIDADGSLKLHYYAQVIATAGPLGVPLVNSIIMQLMLHCSDADKKRLEIIQQSLAWQRTIGTF